MFVLACLDRKQIKACFHRFMKDDDGMSNSFNTEANSSVVNMTII